ncbi:MAG TPA: TRAM domain-containing protein [Verrucomicrobiae bacterium]|nr:TRAM domain-containing protein [Verrucomicrobiae bacterium]
MKAAELKDTLTRKVKQERLDRLQELQRNATFALHQGLVGTVQEVLVEGESRRGGQMTGRTQGNRIVNFDAPGIPAGSLLRVVITEASPNTLRGAPVDPSL